MSRVHLLGIPIDAVSKTEALERLRQMVSSPGHYHVATPNNEMLVEASRNPLLQAVLRTTRLNLPDSTGLLFAARLTGQSLPERVTGVDTVTTLLKDLPSDIKVFLLGAKPGVAARAGEMLQKMNPSLTIVGTECGSPKESDAADILRKINDSGTHLLLVAFGSPAQELWIGKYLNQLSSVRVAMGVGGTFDFIAGEVRRAPIIFRTIGLEWLWRLCMQPWRIKRIFTALVVFPWLVLRHGKHTPIH
jgi:N-acetylglucosaminyldiphosphoundecaprenol N-acetyl-beta-D-mannosaminyltransferase